MAVSGSLTTTSQFSVHPHCLKSSPEDSTVKIIELPTGLVHYIVSDIWRRFSNSDLKPLKGSTTFESKIRAYFWELITKALPRIIEILFFYVSLIFDLECPCSHHCQNVIVDFVVRIRPSKNVEYAFNLCCVACFPRTFYFVLIVVKITKSCFKKIEFQPIY